MARFSWMRSVSANTRFWRIISSMILCFFLQLVIINILYRLTERSSYAAGPASRTSRKAHIPTCMKYRVPFLVTSWENQEGLKTFNINVCTHGDIVGDTMGSTILPVIVVGFRLISGTTVLLTWLLLLLRFILLLLGTTALTLQTLLLLLIAKNN